MLCVTGFIYSNPSCRLLKFIAREREGIRPPLEENGIVGLGRRTSSAVVGDVASAVVTGEDFQRQWKKTQATITFEIKGSCASKTKATITLKIKVAIGALKTEDTFRVR
ncbi:hypothetical protein VNO77_39375 [Canavalia gladiata]|uniref:Uncharacterized protein n=1 Tax=Canavalia gladiata TaxID=3824 RepID=A0AAN9PZQ3_CANGL